MRQFLIGGQAFDGDAPELSARLEHAYAQKLRPLCRCKEPPLPMYIARVDDLYVIKRMPLSGRDHDPACPSYEPPYELSGLGSLIGNAIQIDASGKAALQLDFPLTKKGARSTPASRPEASLPALRNETKKLSLRAVLHYLWEAGELTEWRSSWAGKRGWGRVRTSLINAASQMTARGGALNDILFVPEGFHQDDREGIAARRAAALAGAYASGSGPRKLMVSVAEIKEFIAARGGQKIAVRHHPFPFMIEDGTWKRLSVKYETELELWRSSEDFHLIMIATFSISAGGITSIEEIAMMVVNEYWIPFESIHEQHLLERLSRLKRKSVKGLRFNLSREQPVVSVTLPEQHPAPVAMFIVPPGAGEDYERALAEMIEARPEITAWIWRVSEEEMPKLP
ncbi:hypothetical protein FHS26_000912 [Rhizobium pisi]|uniref:DUF1173 domain-containing protein n=2 Tax=Rhizobium TaxID=379 RepID=A0A7W6FGR6_9HYPH|nr:MULTISPECIES: DUF1173 domain-containing protein [Rhizobium]MBB3133209.1 hypothetical protein [Rhizobium pisi]MBB3913338.1 hypothetical protein [Rhizobium fabae]RSB85817.1 DUF1173 domain-containing protein [Rhizobium pisi]RUM13991.1 DUF1173 domain-containing protein [Rhizobium fabae]TCA61757.1 DUF1173 domain-containing protein [Rhizobium pisi]